MEHSGESSMTEDELFQVQKDKIRKRLLKYTRKAFRMLPQMEKPRILDIGCGSGIPTILAAAGIAVTYGRKVITSGCFLASSTNGPFTAIPRPR